MMDQDLVGSTLTKVVPTFSATIYVGSFDKLNNYFVSLDVARQVCQEYADSVGLCVSFTTTEFIYSFGNEPGAIIGLINYPRFPSSQEELRSRTFVLAQKLLKAMNQHRLTVVFPDDTYMLTNSER